MAVQTLSYFKRHLILLKILVALWVLGLLVLHAIFPAKYVFGLAVFFSVTMNLIYPVEAMSLARHSFVEWAVSLTLIACSLAALVASPILVIIAIF